MAFKIAPTASAGADGDSVMRQAISKILLFAPAHASTLSKIKLVSETDKKACPSMCTDGVTIWYNPDWVATMTWQEVGFVLCHEVDHRHLCHSWRFGSRDPKLWNIAGDARINADLLAYFSVCQLPFTMPPGVLFPWVTPSMTTEQIYDVLATTNPPDPDAGAGFGGPGDGDGEQDLLPAPADAKEADAVSDMSDAMAIAQGLGKLPNHLTREMEQVKDRMVDWKALLSTKIRAVIGADDWGYRRARVSGMRNGVVLPTLMGNKVESVTVVIDSSGSHWHLIEQCFAEVKAIFQAVNPSRVHVLQGDTRLCTEDVYHSASDIVFTASGGDGSDFREVLERARELDSSATVFITDGDGRWPKDEVPKLITVLVGHHGRTNSVPYGQIVEARE